MPTLLEIAQARQIPLTAGIMRAAATEAPALAAFDTRTVNGTHFQALALTGIPTASGFKDYGEGATHGGATLAVREFAARLAVAKVKVEQLTAARWDQEHGPAGTTYFDLQVMARMASEMRHLERTIFYGTVQDAKGFPGLKQVTPFSSANVLELTENPEDEDFVRTVIDAGGTTADTASSVYSVIHGELDCQLVVCNDGGGELFYMTEPRLQDFAPDSDLPDATLEYMVSQISGHFGVAVSGMNQTPNDVIPTQYSVRRLANVTLQTNNKLTGNMMDLLSDSHGDGRQPSAYYMSKRSGRQLAIDGGATEVFVSLGGGGDARNTTTRKQPKAPLQWDNTPIIYTSAIRNNDAIETE
jgi:hypothetical protein